MLLAAMAAMAVVAAVAVYAASQDGEAACGGRIRTLDGIEYRDASAEVVSRDGAVTRLCVLVADTMARRQHGLMRVTDLGDHAGMVFVYQSDDTGAFWMRNTPMPLSIAWFRADGSFVSATDMDPCQRNDLSCPRYSATGPYRYALEVPKGRQAGLGVGDGSRFRLVGTAA